jgi:hypothetical protein
MNSFRPPTRLRRAVLTLASVAAMCALPSARADFSGTPMTFTTDGGWCWFQDPRAIITNNGHLVIGTTAGVTTAGVATGGDEDVTDYNIATGALSTFTLKAAYNRDDHASPAFTVLPDGRVLVAYAGHGVDVNLYWRVSAKVGDGSVWGAEQASVVNTVSDGNNNSYSNPFYLSVPNTVYNFSRAIGYDTNYSKITGLNTSNNAGLTSAANFSYGGHLQYWQNPNVGSLTGGNGGNGRPYVKYAANGTDTVWLATTEDSPQNYANSLYAGYVKFNSAGAGAVYPSVGAALGAISTGTAPTGSANPPTSGGNQGAIASGTGYSYQPYQFTPIVKANANVNGYNLTSSSPYGAGYAPWGSSMLLDDIGNPYMGFVVMRNLNGAYGNNLEYGYARLVNGVWKVSRIGYAGYGLYSSQNQYAGLIAVDALDPNKVYFSANVNPSTGADLLGPDGKRHWQIFQGVTADGSTWSFTQLTNTSSDNVRPIIAAGGGKEALLWMQGTYTTYLNYNTNIVGLIQSAGAPGVTLVTPLGNPTIVSDASAKLRVAASVAEGSISVAPSVQWSTVSGPASAVFASSNSADTTAQFPQSGTYVLQIAADDGAQTTTARLTVVVNTVQDASLALWQKLNETSGVSAADSSGNGYVGTLVGAAAWQPSGGVRGGKLQFDGTSGYVTTSEQSGAASLLDNTSAFTLAFWFRAANFSSTPGLVSKRDTIATNNNYTTYLGTDGRLNVDIESNNDRFASNTVFATNAWYHVALVFAGSNPAASRVALYVNGSLDKTASETSAALSDYSSSFKLGVTAAAANYLNGMLDDVRFYRRALSAAEVANLANGALSPSVSCGVAPSASSGISVTLSGVVSDNDGGAVTAAWSKVSGPGAVAFGDAALPATAATFGQAGTYVLQLFASNASSEVRDQITVFVAANSNVFADWLSAAYPGVTNQSIVGPKADSDGNGITNLMEFALGLPPGKSNAAPWTAASAGLPVQSTLAVDGATYLSLQVRRPIGRLGVTYSAQVSDDLGSWTSGVQAGAAVTNGDSSETVTFRDTVPVSQSTRRIIRLNVSQ